MASVFQWSGSKLWVASIRVWDAAKGKFVHVPRATGTKDKAAAMGIAASLEQASGACKAGTMTRDKALELVNDILRLAGMADVVPVPSLRMVAEAFLEDADVSAGTLRKYSAQWDKLAAWAGKRADEPITAFTVDDMQDFYKDVRKRFSGTTADDHLNFASMVFVRAVERGTVPQIRPRA